MNWHFSVDYTLSCAHPLYAARDLLYKKKLKSNNHQRAGEYSPIVPLWPAESSCRLDLKSKGQNLDNMEVKWRFITLLACK